MDLFKIQKQSEEHLKQNEKERYNQLQELFTAMDDMIQFLESNMQSNWCLYFCCLALLKAKYQSHSIMHLYLNGLYQEATPLYRQMAEIQEIFAFLRQDPNRANLMIQATLPSHREISRKVAIDFSSIYDLIPRNALHFNFAPASIGYLVNMETKSLMIDPQFSEDQLQLSLDILSYVVAQLLLEAQNCFKAINPDRANEELLDKTYKLCALVSQSIDLSQIANPEPSPMI